MKTFNELRLRYYQRKLAEVEAIIFEAEERGDWQTGVLLGDKAFKYGRKIRLLKEKA